MRHPLLRILVAFVIGVWSPLCCCQAMALAGTACDGGHAAVSEPDSCCGGCLIDPTSDHEQQAPTEDQDDDQGSAPGECPSCPSCEGNPSGTGVNAEVKLPAFEQQWDALTTLAVAVLWNLPPLDAQAAPAPPGWANAPPFLKANREALRWHCALQV